MTEVDAATTEATARPALDRADRSRPRPAMIELERIGVCYGKRDVLKEVSLSVHAGEVVALIGANAAGKTTTMRTAIGLKEASSGVVRFNGDDVTELSTHER